MTTLNLSSRPIDVVELTRAICDFESVSGNETALADAVFAELSRQSHLEVLRDGDAIVARTQLGRGERVVLAGHLDTVPVAGNLPVTFEDRDGESWMVGRGTVDMKGGVAVLLALAAELTEPNRDVTYVFYDHEEVEATKNGLGRLVRNHPEWIVADFAVLGEPSSGGIEGGCNGTLRVEVRALGKAAHSARAWMGKNAIHDAHRILDRLAIYEPATVRVDGLDYRESLNAVLISGGIATNVIPDECVVTVNYRFAPDKTVEQALAIVHEVFAGLDVEITMTDSALGARPGLDHPAAAAFVEAITSVTGGEVGPKYGWTDVARFAELGVPAVNFGPGDPLKAHADDEAVRVHEIVMSAKALRLWLGGAA